MTGNVKKRICSGCQAETDADAIFCNQCGAMQTKSANNAEWICTACHKSVPASAGSCPSCGFNLNSNDGKSMAATNGKNTSETGNVLETKNASGLFADGKKASEINKEPEIFSTKRQLEVEYNSLKSKPHSQEKSFSPNTVSAVTKRYRDGYRVARATDGFGQSIKAIGFLIGILIGFIGLYISDGAAEQARKSSFGLSNGGGVAFGSILIFGIIGAIVAIISWILGIIVSAKGQELKASLDSAVHSSPFLSDTEKAQVMSLPLN